MLSFRHALRGFTWSQVAQRLAIENNSKIERELLLYWDQSSELSQYCCVSATHSAAVKVFSA